MKKFALMLCLSILLSSLLLTPVSAVSSGACSDHEGVDCAAGPDSDNSAICYDGWHDSTVNYWAIEECRYYFCPVQSALWDALVEKAESAGYLQIGPSSLCEEAGIPTTGVAGYTTLIQCMELQDLVTQQIYESIFNEVNANRWMCYSETTEKTLTCDYPNSYLANDDLCYCQSGYVWNAAMTECIVEPSNFSDLETSYKYYDAIKYVKENNIVEGYQDGTYKPENEINRAEFTKILMLSKFSSEYASYNALKEPCFTDLTMDDWYTKYVCFAKYKNIIDGYPDNTFKPSQSINAVEALKIILNTYFDSIPEKSGEWYQKYWDFAAIKGLIIEDWEEVSNNVTRGEMAELIYRLK